MINTFGLNLNGQIIPEQRAELQFPTRTIGQQDFQNLIRPENEGEEHQNESIIGTDDRIKIQNTYDYPFYNIGHLYIEIEVPGRGLVGFMGTATLIEPDLIVTAAHNVFIKTFQGMPYNRQASRLTFYPGLNGSTYYADKIQVKEGYIYPPQYRNISAFPQQEISNDYCFLVLKKRLNRFIPLKLFADYPQTNRYIGIYGYPGDKVDQRGNIYMYGSYGTYTLLRTNDLVRYQIDTMGGQSGSALIVFQENGSIGIIGVHTIGDASPRPTYNQGNQFTTAKMVSINDLMLRTHGRNITYENGRQRR